MSTYQEVEKEFLGLLPKKAFAHRLVDTKAARNLVENQPSDYVVTANGVTWYAEVKLCAERVSFPFDNISKGQLRAMALQLRAGGEYFVHIKSSDKNRWYHIPAALILDTLESGKKSLKWSEIDDDTYAKIPFAGI